MIPYEVRYWLTIDGNTDSRHKSEVRGRPEIRDTLLTCEFNNKDLEATQPSNLPTEIDDVPNPQPFDHVLWLDTFRDLVEQASILAGILGTQERRIIEKRLKVRWDGQSLVDDRYAFRRHTRTSTNSETTRESLGSHPLCGNRGADYGSIGML